MTQVCPVNICPSNQASDDEREPFVTPAAPVGAI
jgi:hypothetical protein